MAKVDIFSGFLGAGKTTLIKKLLAEAYPGEKLALIENEFGEISVDGGFLKESGVQISEMSSGCICCSLVGDFGTALRELEEQYHPDRILIEPSGVGKLSEVVTAVQKAADADPNLQLGSLVTVADASRAKSYMKNFGEFYDDQIRCAQTIILSRTQKLSEEKLAAAVAQLREKNPNAAILTTPWDQLDGKTILSAIEKVSLEEELLAHIKAEHEHHHHHDHGPDCDCGCHDHHHEHDHDEHCHEHHHDHDEHCHDHHEHHHDHHEHCHDHHEHNHDHDEHCHDHHEHHHDHHEHCHEHHEHHHDHDEHCHEHHEHHHDHDKHCHDHHEHHHDHGEHCHDEHGHHHEHDHDHGPDCDCGCHDHHGHGHHHHHADEVFSSWGRETPKTFSQEDVHAILERLDSGEYGAILRAKGILPAPDGSWVHFDYVPEEHEIRTGPADYTGRLCVIGAELQEEKLAELFGL